MDQQQAEEQVMKWKDAVTRSKSWVK